MKKESGDVRKTNKKKKQNAENMHGREGKAFDLEVKSPGSKIREELLSRGMLQKEFAVRMGITEKHLSKLINGEVLLTANIASRLATVLGIKASVWSALESAYRESLLQKQSENDLEKDVELAQCFPYAEMAKLGWVPETRSTKERIRNLRNFFEVIELSLLENWQLTGFAGKALSVRDEGDLTLMAWMQAARKKARETASQPLNLKALGELLPQIPKWTTERMNGCLPRLEKELAQTGLILVFLPRLRGLSIQAAAIPSGNRIVIALTEKRMDDHEFWFRLFHELGHVVLGHVWQEEGTTEQDERDANVWARNSVIPRKEFDAFKHVGKYTEQSICDYAAKLGIAPGILVGRLQYEGLIGGGVLNRLKREFDVRKG